MKHTFFTVKQVEEGKLGEMFEKLRKNQSDDAEALAAAERRFQDVSSGLLSSDNGSAVTLPEELMATQRRVAQAEAQLKDCEMRVQHLKKELKVKTNEVKKTENDYKADAQKSKHLENEVKQLQMEMDKVNYSEQAAEDLEQRRRQLQPDMQALRERIESFEARYPYINFKYSQPDRQFDRASVKGI